MVKVAFVFVFVAVAVSCAACAPLTPSSECRQYVRCQAAYDDAAGLDPVDTAAYDADGSCWSSPEFSEACTAECEDALVGLRDAAALADLRVEECDAVDEAAE